MRVYREKDYLICLDEFYYEVGGLTGFIIGPLRVENDDTVWQKHLLIAKIPGLFGTLCKTIGEKCNCE